MDLARAQTLHDALGEIIGYETDNSCSDPDCCGGPFHQFEDYQTAILTLKDFGLKYTGETP